MFLNSITMGREDTFIIWSPSNKII